MRRPTIADIARRAGVTKAAVSFALNGQPGVSAATRERILAIAAEIGFEPSSAARALSDGRAGAFGLIIDRPARTLGSETFFMQLISGIQTEMTRDHVTLLFTMVEDQAEEIRMYRTWWAQRKVDGVFVVDLQVRDRRIGVLTELGMPAGTPPDLRQDIPGCAFAPRCDYAFEPCAAVLPERSGHAACHLHDPALRPGGPPPELSGGRAALRDAKGMR